MTMDRITIAHGAGGEDSWFIVKKLIVDRIPRSLRRALSGIGLEELDDGASIAVDGKHIVFTTDSFTVNPLFFPGGNIGSLAASGTINDLVVMAAKPIAFMDSIVVEEGFSVDQLREIINSYTSILVKYNIALIGGDFKVMPKGSLDKIVITSVGIGLSRKPIVDNKLSSGDKIVVTGPIAEHGSVILAAQLGMLDEVKELKSDSKPLIHILPVIEKYIDYIDAARDPTRGGLAATLNEWIHGSNYTIVVDRSLIPIRDEVRFFLDSLGIDPLQVASEGVAVFAIKNDVAEEFTEELKKVGEVHASIIGEVTEPSDSILRGKVVLKTEVGGKMILRASSLNLPRIC